MGFKPQAGFRATGGFRPGGGAPVEDDDSLFWKAIDILNRPSSATFGAATGLVEGDDPLGRAMAALKGEQEYSGTDLLAAMGADPDSLATKIGGFGLTVLNPLDPLNYVGGLGAATKAGRAARLGGKAVSNWGDAARAGERALLSFAGHRVPVPGDAAVLSGMQRAGQGFMETPVGRGLQTMFGGKRGPAEAAGIPGLSEIFGAEDAAARVAGRFTLETDPEMKAFEALRGADKGPLLESLGQAYRGDIPWEHAEASYIRAGESGAERRKAAWDAVGSFMRKQKGFLGRLEGTGLDAFAEATPGHFKRAAIPVPGQPASVGQRLYEEQLASLTGPSKNKFNEMLIPGGIEPVGVGTLTPAGQKRFYAEGGPEVFNRLQREDPEYVREFLRQYRKTPGELNATESLGFRYETDPAVVFKQMRDEAAQNVRADELVRSLERAGLARPWDEATHAVQADDGRYLFAKVDQGRYAGNPVAVPAEYAQAMKRMVEVLSPGPDKAALGSMLNNALPDLLRNAGVMQWWKGTAIFGGGPSYFVRNFGTGVIKNYYEGLTVWNPQTYRFYPEAIDIIGRQLRGTWDDGYVELGGVKVSKERLWQEYQVRGMSGGGIPDPDITTVGSGWSLRARQKVFKPAHKINEQVEMAIRMPLLMKQVEDTLELARRSGEQVPAVIERLGNLGDIAADAIEPAVARAFENAAGQVKMSHFDYTDMSPAEERLRNFWVPFYSWMRKNIPQETVNMLQRPGQYMPFVRAYYQKFKDAGMTPNDAPEWMSSNFAVPVGQSDDGRNQFLDLTGFLPFMDVVEAADALVGTPRSGETRRSELGRYFATRMNPFLVQFGEQVFQKSALTGRPYGQAPQEMFGATVSPSTAGLVNLFRPARELDRLNPGGAFTMLGNAMGTFEGDVRPRRNEPDEAERWLRFGLGMKIYGADPGQADLSRNAREKAVKRLRTQALKAKREGRTGEAAYFESQAAALEG